MDLATPGAARRLMHRYNFRCRKRLGQNFLVDANIVARIINAAEVSDRDLVVEIGPGLGALTKKLAEKAYLVLAVELDRQLVSILEQTLAKKSNIKIIHADALEVDFDHLAATHAGSGCVYKVVANLPYYITSPLILHLLEKKFHFSTAVIMVQEEVARRLLAVPGNKDYGALTVAVRYHTRPQLVCKVSRNVFLPRPEVDSAVVELDRRQVPPVQVPSEKLFFTIVRAAFGQRRKTLLNALAGAGLGLEKKEWRSIIESAGLNPATRGETLGMQQFAALTRAFAGALEK